MDLVQAIIVIIKELIILFYLFLKIYK